MAFVNERGGGLRRTIDYKRNAIMTFKKGGPEGFKIFHILWNDAPIEFSVQTSIKRENRKAIGFMCHLLSIDIPEYLKPRKSEILEMIKDALSVYGVDGHPENQIRTDVTTNPGLEK